MFTAAPDNVHAVQFPFVQVFAAVEDLRVTKDAVEWGSEFVTHAGEETAFGLVSRVGSFSCFGQLGVLNFEGFAFLLDVLVEVKEFLIGVGEGFIGFAKSVISSDHTCGLIGDEEYGNA